MKDKIYYILTTVFLLTIFFTQFKLIHRPVSDNDEGIYLTSFLLIDKGYPAYKQTYFSQPPGYLLSVYPGFILFGKTLQAARLTIGLWSFIGLLTILWIGYELKNKWAALLAVGLLFLIPYYFNQALTFQSDVLITTFSLISLASLIRFRKKYFLPWFILSLIFFNLAFWTKFDITFFPSIILTIFILFKEKKLPLKKIINLFLIFLAVSFGFFALFIIPFGVKEVFYDSILLRFQAMKSASSAFLLFDYLKKDMVLSFIIITSLILSIFTLNRFDYSKKIIFVWSIFVLFLSLFYRQLFPHHLVILAVPFTLLFSQILGFLFKDKKIFILAVILLVIIALILRIRKTVKTMPVLIDNQMQKAVSYIIKYTNPQDWVISDEEILTGVSGRLPPPQLSDISFIRIKSNNLTSENFKKIINIYKPKLIIPWNGRLESIKNFKEILTNYQILISFSDSKKIYRRVNP